MFIFISNYFLKQVLMLFINFDFPIKIKVVMFIIMHNFIINFFQVLVKIRFIMLLIKTNIVIIIIANIIIIIKFTMENFTIMFYDFIHY